MPMPMPAPAAPVLLDTSVLVDHLRGHPPARAALADVLTADGVVYASVLSAAEIRRGLPPGQARAWGRLAEHLTWLPVDLEIAEAAGQSAAAYRRSHSGIALVDMILAATAQSLGATLWTRNVRHFPMFEGLQPPYA